MQSPQRNETLVTLYNPLRNDFSVVKAADDNTSITYTIPSCDLKTFPKYIADHVAHYLAHAVVSERGIEHGNFDASYQKAMKEIIIEL